uniref:Acyl-CoA-binding domain-containing protein 5 n=1 Tax=Lygus hesperus TaxID=30085 RepID=A0A0A9VV11_LYGHE
MTTEQRFKAAVKVIRNLPKNGSYQPSNELLLDFYAFFKQATEGEKRGGRPPFWEPVNRAKWDAWNRLGALPKEEAMEKYVALLNKIIETMALTDSVAEFLQSMDTYPGDPDDIELSIGPLLQRFRSQPGSPIGSQETTPSRKGDSQPSTPSHISDVEEEEEDDDEFVDTLPDAETLTKTSLREEYVAVKRKDTPMVMPTASHNYHPVKQVEQKLLNGYANHKPSPAKGKDAVNEALQKAIENLRRDLTLANEKVKALEEKQNKASKNKNFLFSNQMTPGTVAFIVVWPVFIHYFLQWLSRRKGQ